MNRKKGRKPDKKLKAKIFRMVNEDDLSYREIMERLNEEGYKFKSWQMIQFHYKSYLKLIGYKK